MTIPVIVFMIMTIRDLSHEWFVYLVSTLCMMMENYIQQLFELYRLVCMIYLIEYRPGLLNSFGSVPSGKNRDEVMPIR